MQPVPAAQVLLYPVIDPACDTDSHRPRATGYFTTHAALQWYWRQYLGGDAAARPAVPRGARPRRLARRPAARASS